MNCITLNICQLLYAFSHSVYNGRTSYRKLCSQDLGEHQLPATMHKLHIINILVGSYNLLFRSGLSSHDQIFFIPLFVFHFVFMLLCIYRCTPLVQWSLYMYKCLWGVEGKRRGSSLQERASHTHTLRLGQSRIFILYKKNYYYYIFYLITKPTLDVALTVNHGHFECHCKNFLKFFFFLMQYFNLKTWPDGLS